MSKENNSNASKQDVLKEKIDNYIERFKGFAKMYRKNKTGLVGLFLLGSFALIAILAPYLAPYDPDRYNRVAAPFSAPMWTRPLDPLAFDNILNALPNPSFEADASSWQFTAEGPNANWFSGGWENDTAHPGMINEDLERKDTGAFYILYNDTDPNARGNFLNDAGILSTSIKWNTTKRPAQIYIWISLRLEIRGNFTVNDFDLYFQTRGPLSENTTVHNFPSPFHEDAYYERRILMNWGHIYDGFETTETDNTVNFMFRFGNIRNNAYNDTGSFKMYFD